VRTAELHAALAQRTGNTAFDPEPITPDDVAAWTERVRRSGAAAFDHLSLRAAELPEPARAVASTILDRREAFLARIERHTGDKGAAAKTRLHGDYHLGQVLLVQNDFVIVDFEGEPTRTLAERREKQSPLKDVAGMLRSFDYAMHVALEHKDGESEIARAARERAARAWQGEARRAFLDGYEDVARTAGLASPRADANGLLELFLLEKVLYELTYEIDHRPDWVRVPLRGLADILDGAE
jgi:maltose alpha-D-glucosyltransferase/alpha-amylase